MILSLLGTLVVLATIHEAYRMYCGTGFDSNADGKLLRAVHCFSVLSNGRKILSMKVTASSANDNFGCIHGIRFFSTCWVVLGHSWSLMPYKTMNPKAVLTVRHLHFYRFITYLLLTDLGKTIAGCSKVGYANDRQRLCIGGYVLFNERPSRFVSLAARAGP